MDPSRKLYFFRFLTKMRLLDSVVIVVLSLIILLLLATSVVFTNMLFSFVQTQAEKTAIQLAKNIADFPDLPPLLADSSAGQELRQQIKRFSQNSDAELIALTFKDDTFIAYSQGKPIEEKFANPYARMGLEDGSPYVYRYTVHAREFISGNAPVRDSAGHILGLISVAYPVDRAVVITQNYLEQGVFYLFLFIIIGLGASIIIARGVKNVIFGLEPAEIAHLFQAQTAIIESIRAGVLATDEKGRISQANSNAEVMLGLTQAELTTMQIDFFFPKPLVRQALAEGVCIYDAEKTVHGAVMLCNIVPLVFEKTIQGVVVTFRKKDEIDMVTRELSQTTRYSEILRAQTHEYANRLHAITGMIQTRDYDGVLDFIASETVDHKVMVRTLTETVDDPSLRSLLIGKYMHAKELKIDFSVDPESSMHEIPPFVSRHELITIIGNLIENAFDATRGSAREAQVRLSMSDFGDLIFEVEDSGPGVDAGIVDTIFERGVTTKKETDHGVGLYLVHQALLSLNGSISLEESDLGGARFVVIIPKLDEE